MLQWIVIIIQKSSLLKSIIIMCEDTTGRAKKQRRFLQKLDNENMQIDPCEFVTAIRTLRKRSRLDVHGICFAALEMMCEFSYEACAMLSHFIIPSECTSALFVEGLVFGKKPGIVSRFQIRSILPLPCIVQLADCIIANV